jgi:PAS domain S-box-containing protein
MDLTIIQSSVTLFMILCVIIVFASIFMRSRFFKEIFEGHPTLATQVLVTFFFGILSIFGTLTGLSIYGAVVNIRDLGPMAAGLLCGPYIGLGAGIIGGLFRFAQGGPYMWTGLSAPILSGVLGGVMYLANKRQFVPTWVAVVLIGLSETLISCYTLILVTKPSEFYMVVTMVAIPMVVFNVIGMFIFATTVHLILDEMKVQKQVQQLELEVESRRNLNTIINTIAYPVYVLDRDHRFTLVNDSICRFIGSAREQILGKTPRDFFNKEDSAFHWEMTESVFMTHVSREDEVTITRPDGLKCILISTSSIYTDTTGREFMVGVIQDITERKRAEELVLKTQLALLQIAKRPVADYDDYLSEIIEIVAKTLDIGRVGIWWFSTDQSEIICADLYDRKSGLHSSGDRLQRSDFPRYFRALEENRTLAAEDARTDERTAEFTASYLVPNGITSMMDIPIRRNGVIIGIICHEDRGTQKKWDLIEQDFSASVSEYIISALESQERKKAEDALRQANRQLKLLSGITRHDINNNITAILGLLALAEMDTKDPSMGDYFRDIGAATRQIRFQIEFTKVYQDLGTHEPQWQELRKAITMGLLVPGTIGLQVNVPSVEIYADPMLEKVFFNLIDNSIRHGQKVTEIRVSARQLDEGLLVVLEDNGVGIPIGEKERIFERGFGKNTGFGLFLVREILSLTGITIKENGVQGDGARFEITVPKGAYRSHIPG